MKKTKEQRMSMKGKWTDSHGAIPARARLVIGGQPMAATKDCIVSYDQHGLVLDRDLRFVADGEGTTHIEIIRRDTEQMLMTIPVESQAAPGRIITLHAQCFKMSQ